MAAEREIARRLGRARLSEGRGPMRCLLRQGSAAANASACKLDHLAGRGGVRRVGHDQTTVLGVSRTNLLGILCCAGCTQTWARTVLECIEPYGPKGTLYNRRFGVVCDLWWVVSVGKRYSAACNPIVRCLAFGPGGSGSGHDALCCWSIACCN